MFNKIGRKILKRQALSVEKQGFSWVVVIRPVIHTTNLRRKFISSCRKHCTIPSESILMFRDPYRPKPCVFTPLALSSSCQYNTTLQLQEPPHRQSNSSHSSHRWSPPAASKYSPPPLRKLKITSFPNLTPCCLLPGHCIVMCCSAFVVLQRTIAAGDLMVDASSPRRQHRKQLKSSEGVWDLMYNPAEKVNINIVQKQTDHWLPGHK